jgi:hypothetical protein
VERDEEAQRRTAWAGTATTGPLPQVPGLDTPISGRPKWRPPYVPRETICPDRTEMDQRTGQNSGRFVGIPTRRGYLSSSAHRFRRSR